MTTKSHKECQAGAPSVSLHQSPRDFIDWDFSKHALHVQKNTSYAENFYYLATQCSDTEAKYRSQFHLFCDRARSFTLLRSSCLTGSRESSNSYWLVGQLCLEDIVYTCQIDAHAGVHYE